MGRIILVSNRLPVTVRRGRRGAQELSVSSGGLVAGLNPLHEKRNGIWIGHPGDEPDDVSSVALATRRLVPVNVPDSDYRAYYEGYGNSALWPLFHYLLETCEFRAGPLRGVPSRQRNVRRGCGRKRTAGRRGVDT